jgi:hypothetical protein
MSFFVQDTARTVVHDGGRMIVNAIKIDPEVLKRVAIHESGHAVIAVIQEIPCHGLFFAYEPSESLAIHGGRFCVPCGNNPPWKKGDYLQSAAGAGAEKLFFGGYNRAASEDDRRMFSTTGAPEWERTVDEAKEILAKSAEAITQMAEAVILKYQMVPMNLWPDRGMNGRTTRFKQILSDEEVRQIVENCAPSATP